MRYIASYFLAALEGNTSPSAKDIKKILDRVGIEADDDQLNTVTSELNGEKTSKTELPEQWQAGQRACRWGCGHVCRPGSAAPAASSAPIAAEEKKDEKKEELEESDEDMGFGLFD